MESNISGLFVVLAYLAPWIIACLRNHRNVLAICVVTLFLGWTLIGWVVALAWACTDNVENRNGQR